MPVPVLRTSCAFVPLILTKSQWNIILLPPFYRWKNNIYVISSRSNREEAWIPVSGIAICPRASHELNSAYTKSFPTSIYFMNYSSDLICENISEYFQVQHFFLPSIPSRVHHVPFQITISSIPSSPSVLFTESASSRDFYSSEYLTISILLFFFLQMVGAIIKNRGSICTRFSSDFTPFSFFFLRQGGRSEIAILANTAETWLVIFIVWKSFSDLPLVFAV